MEREHMYITTYTQILYTKLLLKGTEEKYLGRAEQV